VEPSLKLERDFWNERGYFDCFDGVFNLE
jgi:hypothetical protein